MREYDYGGTTLLRSTRMTYQNSTNYTYRHIFNLPLSVEVYAGDNVTRVSRTDYQYDGQTLSATPNVVQHDQAYNPYADAEGFCYWDYDWNDPDCTGSCWDYGCDGYCPQYYVCPYDYSTEYRGNITQVTTYADAAGPTGALTETRRYDTTGNMVKASTSCCEETSFNYTIDTQYAYPLAKTSGSATDPYAQVTTSATFDFYTAANLSTTDTNGRQSTGTYDTNSLRTTSKVAPTGAHTDFAYDDAALSVTQTSYLAASEGGGIVAQNVKYFNGRKEVWREKALGAGGVWDFVDTTFNNMGQMSQRTRPFRSGDTLQWTVTTYDALGRPRTVTSPDGSMTETFYNEATRPSVASSSPGQTTRVRDPWGRERWARADSSGRIVEVVEPDPSGDGTVSSNGMVTTYGYNTLGKPTSVTQGAQTRTFKYDAVGRLIAQKLAEKNATLNDAGMYVGAGTWSDVFTYDNRSNLTSKTDARGVKTVYNYNSDPLNRLQSVSWDTSGFGDSTNPIVPAGTVTYQYRQKDTPSQLRDVTQIEVISTAAVSVTGYNTSGNSETYVYDTEGRVLRKTLKFNNRLSYPFETDFAYDSLDRAKNVTYPAGYSNGSARKVVHHDYDVASRLSGLTYDGQTHVSNIVYNAASDTNSLSVGTGTNQVNESYSFNGQTGFLESQAAVRNGTTLLNLSYDYVGANGKRTGQLTKISNNLDHNKDRGYEYDALGRLRRATGGQSVNWAQRYEYDRYGNRHNAYSFTAEQYVRNFYQYGLNRQPNSTELQNWLSTLQSAYAQGPSQFLAAMQSLGVSIFSSQEYANRNRSDHDFVYDLYKTYLYREPDASGWAFWESQVQPNGRSNIRLAFDVCPEFSIKVSAISPYSPPGGATVPPDGIQGIFFDSATNRIGNSGWNYDAAGNQTRTQNSAGVWQRFQYDAANRLVKVKADDNVTVLATYAYGATNERLLTEEGGSRTYYDFEGGATIAEYVESGGSTTPSWSKSYVYLGTRLLSTLTPTGGGGEAVQFHHADRLGTRIVSNPANGTSFEQTTLPFGTALSNESTGATNRRFTSYDRNLTTGLDYAYNRHYDPQQGRFTQVDPAEMNAVSVASPQTLNLYSYCVNDPVNHTDPTGLGFFSFLKKAFKWIAKHWKVIVIAAVIVAAIILIPGAQGLISSVFQHAGKFLVSGLGAAAEEGAGHGIVFKLIFGGAIAGAIAGLGTLLQQKKQNMFEKSEDQAFDRLERLLKKGGACAEFLGPHGLDALKAMKNAPRTTRSTGPINNPTGISMAVPALTGNFRTPTSVTFFTNGPFFIGVNKPALGTFPAGSNGAQLVALMHELAHLVKNPNGTGPLIPDDGGNASQSQTNTDTMLNYRGKNGKTCKEEIFDAK